MILKPGVRLHGIRPEVVIALMVARDLWPGPITLTSVVDGTHSIGSLHYSGVAVDLRTKDLPEGTDKTALVQNLKDALGADFDVLLENPGGANEHCHIEWQPKQAY